MSREENIKKVCEYFKRPSENAKVNMQNTIKLQFAKSKEYHEVAEILKTEAAIYKQICSQKDISDYLQMASDYFQKESDSSERYAEILVKDVECIPENDVILNFLQKNFT